MHKEKSRPFLKWPGGKYNIKEVILSLLPSGNRLVEPFVGSGAIFLNSDYAHYTLNDANADLINIYKTLQQHGDSFIHHCKSFFTSKYNDKSRYYDLRDKFNNCNDLQTRAVLFLYLNRHGYNGLCRYNKNGKYNVPFGRYVKPYFPEEEMQFFFQKAKKATFTQDDFSKIMQRTRPGNVVYCDPPYVPLSDSSSFTAYSPGGFSMQQQLQLAELAKGLAKKNISVLISNHDTPFTQNAYQGAIIHSLMVRRTISCNTNQRKIIREILALF